MLSPDSADTFMVDAAPLIHLAKIDALEIFTADEPAFITQAVRREAVLPQAAYRFPEIAAIDSALRTGRFVAVDLGADEERAVADIGRRVPGLGLGERETIAVARARGWSAVLHDRRANRVAQSFGVPIVGIVELLFARTGDADRLASRIRRFAGLVDLRIHVLDQLLERVKERR